MLAAFAESSTGKAYALTCEQYGVDPGAVIDDDDVLAFNFRAACRIATAPDPVTEETTPQEGYSDPGLYERMRAMSRGK